MVATVVCRAVRKNNFGNFMKWIETQDERALEWLGYIHELAIYYDREAGKKYPKPDEAHMWATWFDDQILSIGFSSLYEAMCNGCNPSHAHLCAQLDMVVATQKFNKNRGEYQSVRWERTGSDRILRELLAMCIDLGYELTIVEIPLKIS